MLFIGKQKWGTNFIVCPQAHKILATPLLTMLTFLLSHFLQVYNGKTMHEIIYFFNFKANKKMKEKPNLPHNMIEMIQAT